MIHHAARCTDDSMRTALEAAYLYTIILAAIHRQHMETFHVMRILLAGFGDLYRQFARRCQYQQLGIFLLEIDIRDQRQRECSRLAGTGLCLTNDISAV